MIAGHRRKMASELAERKEIPCIVRNLTDDEAIIIMVDSNLQREQILPSEKAFAYKLRLDTMKRQAGRPCKNNSVPVGQNFGQTSRALLAEKSPDSKTQIYFIRGKGELEGTVSCAKRVYQQIFFTGDACETDGRYDCKGIGAVPETGAE